jgi:CheY-like chemotaxis protein
MDDDRILRKLAVRSIGKLAPEWTVREAASGEHALQLTDSESFDVIFADQWMTSVDHSLTGVETVRSFRAKGVTSVICGLSANNLESSFLKSGADAFMLKPFPCKPDELHALFYKILNTENKWSVERSLRLVVSEGT